jgi:hypothetical protein
MYIEVSSIPPTNLTFLVSSSVLPVGSVSNLQSFTVVQNVGEGNCLCAFHVIFNVIKNVSGNLLITRSPYKNSAKLFLRNN